MKIHGAVTARRRGPLSYMVAYFSKTLPNNPVLVAGRSLKFDLLQTENAEIIKGLRLLVAKGSGGVREISEADFTTETLKKKNSLPSLIRPPGREEYSQMQSPTRLSRSGAVGSAAKGNQPAQPQALPPGHMELVLPTIGRVNEL